jgi:hypothetical protein
MSVADLQWYTVARSIELPATAKGLHRQLVKELRQASDALVLSTSPGDILKHVQLLPEPVPSVRGRLRELDLHAGASCIVVGAEKNQQRNESLPHLRRDDGAWFDFTITVREQSGRVELLAYDFELRLPPGHGTPFLRFDLNLPSHRNEERDLRSHLHPGCDDILVPAPLMTPSELLFVCLHEARLPRERGQRTPTNFELNWLAQSLAKWHRPA